MKKLESTLTNMVLVLTGVAVIMGGILALVNHFTEGPISEVNKKKTDDGIKAVMVCDNLTLAKTDTVTNSIDGKEYTFIVYQVKDAQGKRISVLPLRAQRWALAAT